MREFYQLVNEYPWTTFFILLFVYEIVALIVTRNK